MKDDDDLLAELGVEIPWPSTQRKAKGVTVECGQPAPALRRHTEWSNATTFVFEGYIAMVTQYTCDHCGSMRETFEGVFASERKVATGARRLQGLGRGQQWPQGERHRCEVTQARTAWCPDCIRNWFWDEVEARGTPNDIRIPAE